MSLKALRLPTAYRRGRTLLERVEGLSIPVPETGCWLWVGSLLMDGYPQLGKGRRVGRMLLGLEVGDKRQANHHCDTPLCVNPAHLYVGTASENTKDIHRRKPGVVGWAAYNRLRRGGQGAEQREGRCDGE